MRQAVRTLVLFVAALMGAVSPSAAAGPAELLRDINLVEEQDGSGLAGPLLPAGNRVVFPARVSGTGNELWGSDGTSLGTEMLRDILPGGSEPRFTPVGSVPGAAIFLVRQDDFNHLGLWRSDGTPEGTFPIGQVAPCFDLTELRSAVVGSFLFFRATDGNECSLWKTDGTAAGTTHVKDVDPVTFAGGGSVSLLVSAGGRLFFFYGPSLWVSDGTSAGTSLLRALPERAELGLPELTPAGSRVFFVAPVPGRFDEELWTSDGTPAGTRPVTSFFEPRPFLFRPVVTVVDGVLYFLANDGTGTDLWRSDGTVAGTWRVTDFVEADPFPLGSELVPFVTRLGKLVFFPAREEGGDWRLWTSEGTPATTAPLEGCPGGCPQVSSPPLVRMGNRAVFAGSRGAEGSGLWVTDGTGSGTRRLAGLCLDCGGYLSRGPLFPFLGKTFFLVRGSQGVALWRTDGTPEGTMRLVDLGVRPFESFPFAPVEAGGKISFSATLGNRGAQLWTSDGTPAGTGLVTLFGGTPGSFPAGMAPFGGGALFAACDGAAVAVWRSDGTEATPLHPPGEGAGCGTLDEPRPVVVGGLAFYLSPPIPHTGPPRLWRSDGTAAGTFPVTPEGIGRPRELVAFGNRAVFLVDTDIPEPPFTQTTFWTSDGTVAGTRPLSPSPAFFPHLLTALASRLFFVANDLETGEQLWMSDGTAPPQALTHLEGAFEPFEPHQIAQVGTYFFFTAQKRLWRTDGTAAGTAAVAFPGPSEGFWPTSFAVFQGALHFTAGTALSPTGRGLWRSDGTEAGTFLVKPVGSRIDFLWEPARLIVAGDRLFFAAEDGDHGIELWSSDGTAAGTVMVRDINPGEASSHPFWLTAAGRRLFFAANDGRSGFELWESDGTAAGTRRVQDIAPGAGSSNPRELTVSGNRLFFAADDGVHGEEPWTLPLESSGCMPAAGALCLGGRFRVEAEWRDFQGNRGVGRAVALTADTGYFWFFDAANLEVILKMLDGRGLNGHHWVFYGALSNVEYRLTVTDTRTGAVRRYINPPGRLGSVADTEAFGPRGASEAGVVTLGPAPAMAGEPLTLLRTSPATGSCSPSATRLCLKDGRFAVEARWTAQGQSGTGQAVPVAGGDTGYFWFFDAANVEVVLKVLDGRPLNGKFWVFYGALSDVEYTLIVTDTMTGVIRIYTNPSGRLASVADTGAF